MMGLGDLLEMRQAGCRKIAQDETSRVVFGMPKEAINLSAAKEVLSLSQIPAVLEGKA